MQPNPNVYGAPEEWILSAYDMQETFLAPWGSELEESQLQAGVTEGKILLRQPLDQSISYVGLGAESPYSDIITINTSGTRVHDTRFVTNFFYAYGDPITYDYYIPNENAFTWDVDSLVNQNYNRIYRPIIAFNPKRLLWAIMVICGRTPTASGSGNLITVGMNSYRSNETMKAEYPYLRAAFMYPLVDTSTTSTPNWNPTLQEPMHLCINERRNVEDLEYITFNDLKITSAYYRGGILLRGSIEGIGNTFISSTNCVYMLGDEDCIIDSGSNNYIYAEAYNDDVEEVIMKAAACFCNYFIGRNPWPEDWEHTALNSDAVFLGKPDEYGIGHGEYTNGEDNEDNPVWDWEITADSDYNYKDLPPEYDNTNHFNYVSVANFNKYYVMNYNEVKALAREVYEALSHKPSGVTSEEYSIDTFFTSSPIDGIIKILRYPLIEIPNNGLSEYIKIGAYTSTTLQARAYVNTTTPFYNFVFSGSKKLNEAFGGSFLDREPYTTAELTIPFCGTVPIAVSDYIGHTITVKLAIDFKTGSCTAYILKDNTPLQSANGQIGIDIPITGISSATIDSQLMHANLQLKSAQNAVKSASYGFLTAPASMAASVAGGGKFGVAQAAQGIGGLLNTGIAFEEAWNAREAASYDLHHIQPQYKQIAAGSPTTAAMGEYCCRLTIYRPILSDDYNAAIYGHTIGFATLENNSLSNYTGFTVAANADLSGISATAAEKAQISDLLKSGIYI